MVSRALHLLGAPRSAQFDRFALTTKEIISSKQGICFPQFSGFVPGPNNSAKCFGISIFSLISPKENFYEQEGCAKVP